MTIFYYSFIILALLACLTASFRIKKQQYLILYLFVIVLLSLLAGLRYDNADYENYLEIFKKPWEVSPDKGFSAFVLIVRWFTTSPIYMFLLVAIIAVSLNISSYRKYSPYLFVSVLFYFVHSFLLKEYVQIRAGLSCAICLYAIRYIEYKSLWKYIACMVIAMSIHMSSIIFFPMFWLYYFMKNKSNSCLMYFLLLSFIIGTLYPFGQVIKAYVPFLDETSRIATYANWDQFNNEIGILTNFTTLKQIILCVLCYIYWTRLKEVIACFSVLYLAYVLSTCWLMLFNDFVIIGARMATFLSVGEPIFFAGFLCLFNKQSRILVTLFFIIISCIIMDVNLHTKNLGEFKLYPLTSLF